MVENRCPRCKKMFSKKCNLKRHLKRKFPCQIVDLLVESIESSEEELDDISGVATLLSEEVSSEDEIIDEEIDENKFKFDDLPRFDMDLYEPDKCYSSIFVAIRRSGKTYLLKSMYDKIVRDNDIVFFLSNSIHNTTYDFVKENRFTYYNNKFFSDILRFQRGTNNEFRIAVILDDMVSVTQKYSNGLLQFFVRGRNCKISVYFSSQTETLINKTCRQNSDFIFIGNTPTYDIRENIIQFFLKGNVDIPKSIKSRYMRNDYIDKFLLHHTKDYKFLVIDNIERKLFTYRVN